MPEPNNACPARRTKFVGHALWAELVILQSSFAFVDNEAASAREDPFVAFARADATVADHDACYFGYLNVEFECPAVAVAVVGFEVAGGGRVGHREFVACGAALCV